MDTAVHPALLPSFLLEFAARGCSLVSNRGERSPADGQSAGPGPEFPETAQPLAEPAAGRAKTRPNCLPPRIPSQNRGAGRRYLGREIRRPRRFEPLEDAAAARWPALPARIAPDVPRPPDWHDAASSRRRNGPGTAARLYR